MNSKRFILITFLTLILFNVARIIGWRFLAQTYWWNTLLNDRWHHYQIGFLLLLVAFLILRKKKSLRNLTFLL